MKLSSLSRAQQKALRHLPRGCIPKVGSNRNRSHFVNSSAARALVRMALAERIYWGWAYRFRITTAGYAVLHGR